LRLFFEKLDHFSIITLAGAAEVILVIVLELKDESSALSKIVRNTAMVHKHLNSKDNLTVLVY
jgi:hypothetical protein